MSTNSIGSTHIEFKVFGRGVDAASGWVVTWYVVHCHMLDPHRMRESDGKSSLGTSEWPTPPREQWCQTLGREEMQLGNNIFLHITNSGNNTPNHRRYKEMREGGDHSLYLNNSPWAQTDGPNRENTPGHKMPTTRICLWTPGSDHPGTCKRHKKMGYLWVMLGHHSARMVQEWSYWANRCDNYNWYVMVMTKSAMQYHSLKTSDSDMEIFLTLTLEGKVSHFVSHGTSFVILLLIDVQMVHNTF